MMKFRIVVEQDEDGKFVTSCPTLPGCWSEGDTRDEAVRNMSDAIEGYLESLRKHGDPFPPPITEEIIDIDLERKAG
jgi:antitoxin HicB